MSGSQILDRLRVVVAQMCNVNPAEVLPVARLRGFAIDSLRVYELVMALEEEFRIQLELEDLQPVRTIADLVELLNSRLKAGRVPSTQDRAGGGADVE